MLIYYVLGRDELVCIKTKQSKASGDSDVQPGSGAIDFQRFFVDN